MFIGGLEDFRVVVGLTGFAVLRGRRQASRGGDGALGADVSGAAVGKAIQSFRLRLHSGLRQSGAHASREMPRDGWGTRCK